jgi:hypothetical protein
MNSGACPTPGSVVRMLLNVYVYNYVYIIVSMCEKCTDFLGFAGNVRGLNTALNVNRIAR